MTFIEAAIEILRQVGRPLPVRELTERSIKQNLLSHLGRTPDATMQTRLTAEAKKGDRTPLVQKSPGVFGLRHYDRPAAKVAPGARSVSTKPVAARAATPKPAAAKAKVEEEEGEGGKRRRRRRGGKGKADAPETVEDGTPEEAILAERLSEGASTDAATATDTVSDTASDTASATDTDTATDSASASASASDPAASTEAAGRPAHAIPSHSAPSIDLDALRPSEPRRYPRIVELPTDETLAAEYADEIASGSVAPPAASEVIDSQSADEDRPLLAEIKDDRDRRGRRRGRDRDRKKDEKKGAGRPEQSGHRAHKEAPSAQPPHQAATKHPHGQPRHAQAAPQASSQKPQTHPPRPPSLPQLQQPTPPPATPPAIAAIPAAVATDLRPVAVSSGGSVADIAYHLLRALNDPRPVHARQLAAMAVKRKLLAGDPEELWRIIRVALAADARDRQSAGLRPRTRALSGGLFALATARLDDAVRAAEDALGASVSELARVTREGLRAAVARLPLGAAEHIARLHLERAGFRDIERVKRTGDTSYLIATHARGKHLVGARTGGADVGRYSVGELRAGVEAKGVAFGLLLAAGPLGSDGARELVAPGPTVHALVGDDFAEALVRAGIGVVRAAVSVAYLDLDLLGELGE
jgi:HB1, ASXL, restriction endonuclease HTH domain/Restriction endonuclease